MDPGPPQLTTAPQSDIRLRPLRAEDEAAFAAAHRELLADGFEFGFLYDGQPLAGYARMLDEHRRGIGLPEGWVECTFLVAVVAGELVGRAAIRHRLTEFLEHEAGHIGYAVRPAFRRRGYATEMLRQSLVIARSLGVDRVLVTCDDDNEASVTVIERCGGVLENVVTDTLAGVPKRRYWID